MRNQPKTNPVALYGVWIICVLFAAWELSLYLKHFEPMNQSYVWIFCYHTNILTNAPTDLLNASIYGPIYRFYLNTFHFLFGNAPAFFTLANFLIVPLIALYLIALSRLFKMENFAVLPCILFFLLPGTLYSVVYFSMEILLGLFVIGFVYHLFASRSFSDRPQSILCGLFAGLGLLTKISFAAYVIAPFLFVVASSFYSTTTRTFQIPLKEQWKNFLFCTLFAGLISGWWFLFIMPWDFFLSVSAIDAISSSYSYLFNIQYIVKYFIELTANVSPALFFGFSLLCVVLSKPWYKSSFIAIISIIPVIALFSYPHHLDQKYLIPILCAVPFALGYAISRIRIPKFRIPAAVLAIAIFFHIHLSAINYNQISNLGLWLVNRPASSLLVKYIQKTTYLKSPNLKKVLHGKPIRAINHPFYSNIHLTGEYIFYTSLDQFPLDESLSGNGYWFSYGGFHDKLMQGGIDILFLDCGPDGDCSSHNAKMVEKHFQSILSSGNANPFGETPIVFQSIQELENALQEDFRIIRTQFVEMLYLPLDDNTHTRIFYSQQLLDMISQGQKNSEAEPPAN